MRTLEFDAAKWCTPDDIYRSFNAALVMPDWWNEGINGLTEALITHRDVAERLAGAVIVHNVARAPKAVREEIDFIARIVREHLADFRRRHGRDCPLRFILD